MDVVKPPSTQRSIQSATSNAQCLLDIDITTLHQCCVNFAKDVKYELFMVAW